MTDLQRHTVQLLSGLKGLQRAIPRALTESSEPIPELAEALQLLDAMFAPGGRLQAEAIERVYRLVQTVAATEQAKIARCN